MRTDFKFRLSAPQPKSVWFTTGVREPAILLSAIALTSVPVLHHALGRDPPYFGALQARRARSAPSG